VEGFVGADTCGISVALVGENQVIRQYTFDSGGNGSWPSGGGPFPTAARAGETASSMRLPWLSKA